MSRDVSVEFEVRSLCIMEDTLKEMEIPYSKSQKNILTIKKPYHNIVINSESGKISYDEENKNEVDILTRNYMVNWYKDQAIREGNEIREEVMANGEIHLHVLN